MTETPFCGLRLLTEPGKVMTPRPATEALVETAVERIGDRPALVADVGTGSGAVALAIAAKAPRARIWATDTSCAAVRLARANVCRHGLGDRISVVHGDLLEGVPPELDLVVANLPYLAARLRGDQPELAGEPPEAVFAAGDGLGPYRRLVRACVTALRPDGVLALQLYGRVVAGHAPELSTLALAA
ncbi:MAG TPA: HemK family protein methyltransferase [Gaiellaceae bacterium]|nr:HemK family protein methyltransferase [Gaiellaceae bacterium]